MPLVLLPPFDSAILEPDFDLFYHGDKHTLSYLLGNKTTHQN